MFRNPSVHPEALLAPHLTQTARRARAHPVVWIVHDTTDLCFGGDTPRAGLGPLTDRGHGFKAHVAFAITPMGQPLGVLHLWAWRREHGPGTVSASSNRSHRSGDCHPPPQARPSR